MQHVPVRVPMLVVLVGMTAWIAVPRDAVAQETIALRGSMFLSGKTPVDPPPEEPKNSHAYMTVTGPAALRMYRQMAAKPEKNLCEEGRMIKRAGALSCTVTANGREATCDYSVDLLNGKLDNGRAC